MAKNNLRINLEYWLARAVLSFFRLFPLPLAIRAGGVLSHLSFLFGRLRRTAETNLQLAFPEMSQEERRRLMRGCFENLGRSLAVFSHFTDSDQKALKDLIDPHGLEHLKSAQTTGQGVILFTGHIGGWELSSFGLSLLGSSLSFLVRRIDNPRIETLVDRARTQCGNRTIDKRSAAREMFQILRRGGTLGLLIDLNTLDREAIFVDFFAVPAATTFLVAKLALRTGAQVLPVFAPWDKERRKFLLLVDEPIKFSSSGDETRDVQALTQAYTSVLEKYVRRYPDQWLWIHRRWKTRPPGEKNIY